MQITNDARVAARINVVGVRNRDWIVGPFRALNNVVLRPGQSISATFESNASVRRPHFHLRFSEAHSPGSHLDAVFVMDRIDKAEDGDFGYEIARESSSGLFDGFRVVQDGGNLGFDFLLCGNYLTIC